MTRLRVPPISRTLLQPILEAGPFLAGRTARAPDPETDEGAAAAFGLAHPIHIMGLRELVAGGRMSKAPAAIRVLESRGSDISAFYDVSPSESAPQLLQMAGADNPYLAALEQGIDVADRWAEAREGPVDLRLLRIPALYTEALLLRTHGAKEEIAIVIRSSQEGVETLKPMPLSELVELLAAPARLILENEDGLKGS